MAVMHNYRYFRFKVEGWAREIKVIAAESADFKITDQLGKIINLEYQSIKEGYKSIYI